MTGYKMSSRSDIQVIRTRNIRYGDSEMRRRRIVVICNVIGDRNMMDEVYQERFMGEVMERYGRRFVLSERADTVDGGVVMSVILFEDLVSLQMFCLEFPGVYSGMLYSMGYYN